MSPLVVLLLGVVLVVIILLVRPWDRTDDSVEQPPPVLNGPVAPPSDTGKAALGPASSDQNISATPTQAGEELTGAALPTNQWWTSALIERENTAIWAYPVAVRTGNAGVELAVSQAQAQGDAVVSPFIPMVSVGTPTSNVTVAEFGHFDVQLDAPQREGSPLRVTVAQGSPAVWVELPDEETSIALHPSARATEGTGARHLVVEGSEATWDLVVEAGGTFEVDSTAVAVKGSARLTLIARPRDAADGWVTAALSTADRPVATTRAVTSVDENKVTQELIWHRPEGAAVVTLLPHHVDGLTTAPEVLGTYPTPRGTLTAFSVDDPIKWSTTTEAMVLGLPEPAFAGEHIESIRQQVVADTELNRLGGGSYFGPKNLSRSTTLLEVAERVGADDQAEQLLRSATAELIDRLDYSGEGDGTWFTYDPFWGGMIAVPPEFGSQDYNDHHFHYGYLIHAAAVVAERDPDFLADYGPMVDLLAADLLGSDDSDSFSPLGVFNPYLGHSYAAGFGLFADGNNQESSSEAMNAWWALSRWSAVTSNEALARQVAAIHAIEATATRHYWLGEAGDRPDGYNHQVAGIVWDGKIDFATFFDPHPSKVIGIQLLPFNFGSLYRNNPVAAAERFAASGESTWPDLSLMDLGLADPQRALAMFAEGVDIEEGNTASFSLFWLHTLDALGAPSTTVTSATPGAMAFERDEVRTFVATNPTEQPRTFVLFDNGTRLGSLTLPPRATFTGTTLE